MAEDKIKYNLEVDSSQAEKDLKDFQKKAEQTIEQLVKTQEKNSQKSVGLIKTAEKEILKEQLSTQEKISAGAANALSKVSTAIKSTSVTAKTIGQDIKGFFTDAFTAAKEKAQAGMGKISESFQKTSGVMKKEIPAAMEEAGKSQEKTGGRFEKITSVAKSVGSGLMEIGKKAQEMGTKAVSSAVSMEEAMNSFAQKTGKGTEETEKYRGVLEKIYSNNYGESFTDIASAMAEVTQKMGDMDDGALQSVTESAYALKDAFGYDISESAEAAKAIMDGFGMSGEEAMNMIAAGAQNGSFTVQQIGEAAKEMSTRIISGSEEAKGGFEEIGLNAEEMTTKFAAGGESAKEAFAETMEALAQMEDPLEQNAAGAALFGETWSEMGPEVASQLADVANGTGDIANAMDVLKEANSEDLGTMFEGLQRSVETMLVPLGEELMPILGEIIQTVGAMAEEVLPPLVEAIGGAISQMAPIVSEILPQLSELIVSLMPTIMEIINGVLPILIELFQNLIPPIAEIITAVLPVLLELINALLPIFQILIDLLMPVIDLFMQLLAPILDLISSALVPLVNALMPIIQVITESLLPVLKTLISGFSEAFSGIVSCVGENIGRVTTIINNIVDFIKNVFAGNWKAAWENIKTIFSNVIDGLASIFKMPINAMIDLINGFIRGIGKIKIPDWVPAIGGKGFHIPEIPRLRIGMEYVPTDDYLAFLHKGEAVLTAQENAIYQSVGGFEGMMRALGAPAESGEVYVTVQNNPKPQTFDYAQMGAATAEALGKAGLKVVMERRELGRVVREVQR